MGHDQGRQIQRIQMKELHGLAGKLPPGEVILDVRSAEEYREGHVPGSRNIPHDEVASHAGELRKYRKIYVHCQAGGRAGFAIEALLREGLTNLVCVAGSGMGDWIAAGFPVEK